MFGVPLSRSLDLILSSSHVILGSSGMNSLSAFWQFRLERGFMSKVCGTPWDGAKQEIRSPGLAVTADYGHCFLWAVKRVLNPAVASQRVLPTNKLVLGLLQYFRIWRCLISVDKLHFSLCYAGDTALVLRPAVLCSTELCDIRAQLCLCIHRFWVFRKWF